MSPVHVNARRHIVPELALRKAAAGSGIALCH